MKIAIFLESYLTPTDASAAHVSILRAGLIKRGHEVLIVTSDLETDECYEQDNIVYCPARPSPNVCGQSARVGKTSALFPYIDEFAPDLVHIHTITETGAAGLKYAQKNRLPVVCTLHNLHDVLYGYETNKAMDLLSKKQCQLLFKKIVSASDLITTASQKNKDIVKDFTDNAVQMIPYCVDTELFQPILAGSQTAKEDMRARLHLTGGKAGFVYTGQLSEANRLSDLLELWSRSFSVKDNLQLVLVGSGKDASPLMERAKVLGITDRVTFAGGLTRDDLNLCYSVCKAFVSASTSPTMESFPLEAIAGGLPVLLKADCANADLVISGVNGFTYHTDQEFAELVKKLAQLDADGEILMRKLVRKTAASLTDMNQAISLEECYQTAIALSLQKPGQNG